MHVEFTLPAVPTGSDQPHTPQLASAMLLGLVARLLCQRLELPGTQLLEHLAHQVGSLTPADSALKAELDQQLAVLRQFLEAPSESA